MDHDLEGRYAVLEDMYECKLLQRDRLVNEILSLASYLDKSPDVRLEDVVAALLLTASASPDSP